MLHYDELESCLRSVLSYSAKCGPSDFPWLTVKNVEMSSTTERLEYLLCVCLKVRPIPAIMKHTVMLR